MLTKDPEAMQTIKTNKTKNVNPYNCLLNVFCGLFEKRNKTSRLDDLKILTKDTGGGPISKGMIFLELVSSTIRRNNTDTIKEFDLPQDAPVIPFVDSSSIKQEEKTYAVIQSLGLESLCKELKELDDTKYTIFIKYMTSIYNKVHEGSFYRKNYRVLLPYIKNCANFCLRERYRRKR